VEPLILSVGRLVEKKGFSDLIGACRMLKGWGTAFKCEIVGSGPLSRSLRDQIKELKLEACIRVIGAIPQSELQRHYRDAIVFALPSVLARDGDRDILPNVLKEAMAVGVPVVTTRLPGIEELIAHGEDGLLTPSGDVAALAASLECLLTDAALRRRLAGRARKTIEERFDMRKNFTLLKNLLLEATTRQSIADDLMKYEQTP